MLIAHASPCRSLAPSEFIPTSWPRSLTSGPPELPGLMAAVCWITDGYTGRSGAISPFGLAGTLILETWPNVGVTVDCASGDHGKPSAVTSAPGTRPAELANSICLRPAGGRGARAPDDRHVVARRLRDDLGGADVLAVPDRLERRGAGHDMVVGEHQA